MTVGNKEFRPRNGSVFQVLVVARISTVNQDRRSLDDQIALCERTASELCDGPIEFKKIPSIGSGEILDRDSFKEMESDIASQKYDLVICEDLARICRRMKAGLICEDCEDCSTRLYAINDHLDTFNPDWRMKAVFSSLHHEQHNKDTSQRIRRSHDNRFRHGGVVGCLPYGYVKPHAGCSDEEVEKDPDAGDVYDRWFSMLEDGATYAEVADYLNAARVPTGPYVRSEHWTAERVGKVTHNSLLKGVRVRGTYRGHRVNHTGKKKRQRQPEDSWTRRECPHLAHIEPERYDRVIEILRRRNGKYRRGGKAGSSDSRAGLTNKRTVYPGQSIICGLCGRVLYYGAHGQKQRMVCSGNHRYRCWNGVSLDAALTRERVVDAVWSLMEQHPGFDAELLREISRETEEALQQNTAKQHQLRKELQKCNSGIAKLVDFITENKTLESPKLKLAELEQQRRDLVYDLEVLERDEATIPTLPPISELREEARRVLHAMPKDSPEFLRAMQRAVRDFRVWVVRPLDGGQCRLRGGFYVDLTGFCTNAAGLRNLDVEPLRHYVEVDLFDPPRRVRILRDVERLLEFKQLYDHSLTEYEIASMLKTQQPTVQNAKKLLKLVKSRGTTSPYERLDEPPEDDRKLTRHLHPRYKFDKVD